MSTDEFDSGMHHNIGSVLKWTHKVWCGKGIIDDQWNAKLLANFCCFLKWKHINQRITRRLTLQDLGVWTDGTAEVLRVAWIYQSDFYAQAGK